MNIQEILEDFYDEQLGYKIINGKKLKNGITTGTVATACAKAGVLYLLDNIKRKYVNITTANNKNINILIEKYEEKKDEIIVYIRKYAGSDIDATSLALIYASVKKRTDNIINITGGVGVGIVTKEGLDAKIGESAINKTPKKNITTEIRKISNYGYDIKICVKDGDKISKKTFNERLGIINGISIIGTTGIVEPMSVDSIKSSIEKEINIKAKNTDNIILTFGNMGEKALNIMGVSSEKICICSNYVGDALENIQNYTNIKNVLIAGNFAKVVKLAGAIYNTHSHIADAKNEIIVSNLAMIHAPYELLEKVMNSNTTKQVSEYIKDYKYEKIYDILAEKAREKCEILVKNNFDVSIIFFDYDNNVLNSYDVQKFL